MARSGTTSRPGRALISLVALLAVLFGIVAAGSIWSSAQWTPKLALDLEGGTQLILTPKAQPGFTGTVTPSQLTEAVNIIRQRVNGTGVTEAEVTTQGNNKIVVSLPGALDKKTVALVEQSAALTFRPVLVAGQGQALPVSTATSGSPTSSASPTSGASPAPSASRNGAAVQASPSASSNGRVVPKALTAATTPATRPAAKPAATPTGAAKAAATPSASRTAAAVPTPSAAPETPEQAAAIAAAVGAALQTSPATKPKDASDLSWATPAVQQAFAAVTCSTEEVKALQLQLSKADPAKPLITCQDDGTIKYVLGPVEVKGTDIKSAAAALATNQQGATTGGWEVQLNFTGAGTKKFADVTARLAALTDARNQFAIVLDQLVVSAPRTDEKIPGGQAQITGNFTQDTATTLANQLKFGALPLAFQVETQQTISALLGGEYLQRGLLAGIIGLILVVVYSLLQYRALGSITVFSLMTAASFTYGLVLLLGWRQGFRLSLAGVTGLIVAIGITADSFIVYFERVRDEVRDGRPLRAAVEAGWARARRTILASDAVSFLAAVVLFFLAVGGVQGFAFTLGLTTLVDVLVVFLFTKPAVTLLSRTHFFGGGHPLSGFSPAQLGKPTSYAGRGRVRSPGETIAARRAAAARAAEQAGPPGPPGAGEQAGPPGGEQAGTSAAGQAAGRGRNA